MHSFVDIVEKKDNTSQIKGSFYTQFTQCIHILLWIKWISEEYTFKI